MTTTLELLILGASSATPTSNQHTTSQLLKIRDHYFLIDCGEGTQQQLRRAKVKFTRINHIFISHLHGDHFFGLVGLLSSFHLLGRKTPLHVYGPPKLKEIILGQFRASGTFTSYPLHFHSTQDKEVQVLLEHDVVTVTSFPLKHRVPTTGFRFDEKPLKRGLNKPAADQLGVPVCDYHWIKDGKDWTSENGKVISNEELTFDPPKPLSFAFASDTIYRRETSDYVRGVDLLYHESTFCEDWAQRAVETMHSTAKQAATVALDAGVQVLLLGHYSARYPDRTSFQTEAQEIFHKSVLAKELWRYRLSSEFWKEEDLNKRSNEE